MARRQLLRAGLSINAVDHLVAAGTLVLLYRGVYAVGHRQVGRRSREPDGTRRYGIPVTTPLRTLLDLSGTLPLDAMDAALAEALVRKLVMLEPRRNSRGAKTVAERFRLLLAPARLAA